ncbi:MAG TPA: hypothetical protein VNL16_03795 [Chloroflexota bacterium]|nr:hypothetical protein [Chloroflexota bacterium]
MGLPIFGKRRVLPGPRPLPEESSERERESYHPEIDVTKKRVCIYREFVGAPGPCPRCGKELVQSYQFYLVATFNDGVLADRFCLGSDFGWFCTQCLTVEINPRDVDRYLENTLPHWNVGAQRGIVGLVDLEASRKRGQRGGPDELDDLIVVPFKPWNPAPPPPRPSAEKRDTNRPRGVPPNAARRRRRR